MLTSTRFVHSELMFRFKISLHILEGLRLELAECESDDDLGYLFETNRFTPELEEYLFARMDKCPDNKSYLQLVQEELHKWGSDEY